MRRLPSSASRSIRPWPISPPAPVIRTTERRITGVSPGGVRPLQCPRAAYSDSRRVTSRSRWFDDGHDGGRLAQVDTGALQQRHRVVAAAGLQQVEVAANRLARASGLPPVIPLTSFAVDA